MLPSNSPILKTLIVQPRTPKADREDMCPHKKQTIHNALMRPEKPGPLQPHHPQKMLQS
jgi:hypothetical protein